jgi:hypothetical protein
MSSIQYDNIQQYLATNNPNQKISYTIKNVPNPSKHWVMQALIKSVLA